MLRAVGKGKVLMRATPGYEAAYCIENIFLCVAKLEILCLLCQVPMDSLGDYFCRACRRLANFGKNGMANLLAAPGAWPAEPVTRTYSGPTPSDS
jgi:hypothetical protein